MFDWWRSWHGAPTDDKWLVIAKRAGVPAIAVPAIAWALLDHASQSESRGDVSNFDFEAYALKFGIEEDQVRAVFNAMETRAMIVSGRIAQWDKRQTNSSTERSRKHRGKGGTPELPLDAPAPQPSPRDRDDTAPPDEPSARAETELISPQAAALADQIAVAAGHDLEFVPPSWCGAASRVQVWLSHGWPAPIILESAKAQMTRKRDGPPSSVQYFEKGIAAAIARADAPMPTVVPFPSEARHGKAQSAITAAADRLIAELESGGGQVCEDPSRMLSDRRRE